MLVCTEQTYPTVLPALRPATCHPHSTHLACVVATPAQLPSDRRRNCCTKMQVHGIKQIIGRQFLDKEVALAARHWPFQVVQGHDGTCRVLGKCDSCCVGLPVPAHEQGLIFHSRAYATADKASAEVMSCKTPRIVVDVICSKHSCNRPSQSSSAPDPCQLTFACSESAPKPSNAYPP